MRRRMNAFRLHPIPVIAGVAVAVLTVMLGNWQTGRAAEKRDMRERIELAAERDAVAARELIRREAADAGWTPDWVAVALEGEWYPEATIYLDNRVYNGRPGYHVLTPMSLDGGDREVATTHQGTQGTTEIWILVNRGWVPMGADRAHLPEVPTADGRLDLRGLARVPEASPFTLAATAGEGTLWQYLDLAQYREWSGIPVRGWIVQQDSAADDGLVRDWPRPDTGEDRHRGYALQWYSFAVLALALTGFYVFRGLRGGTAHAGRSDATRSKTA